eukprot:TRINITY_DN32990_c0_g1_i1.p1 TRINITY_DN32990_c0_g1~~TRINITY_DN32990_c0_g1_i1.p1  ORF type:complete len:307 (+),score=45.79 TRINITY_DN32990_c0_g1_i1:89-1009(+)
MAEPAAKQLEMEKESAEAHKDESPTEVASNLPSPSDDTANKIADEAKSRPAPEAPEQPPCFKNTWAGPMPGPTEDYNQKGDIADEPAAGTLARSSTRFKMRRSMLLIALSVGIAGQFLHLADGADQYGWWSSVARMIHVSSMALLSLAPLPGDRSFTRAVIVVGLLFALSHLFWAIYIALLDAEGLGTGTCSVDGERVSEAAFCRSTTFVAMSYVAIDVGFCSYAVWAGGQGEAKMPTSRMQELVREFVVRYLFCMFVADILYAGVSYYYVSTSTELRYHSTEEPGRHETDTLRTFRGTSAGKTSY